MTHAPTILLSVAALLSACSSAPSEKTAARIGHVPPAAGTPLPAPAPAPASAPAMDIEVSEGVEEVLVRQPTSVMDVWVLDVGQGTCIYVACPDGESSVLIDCGTMKNGGASSKAIGAWINVRTRAAKQASLVISHPHKDHLSHLRKGAVAAEPFNHILAGGQAADYPASFIIWAQQAKSAPQFFRAGEFKRDEPRLACGAATFDLLTVNATEVPGLKAEESKQNADSAVLRLSFAGHTVVLPGDAEAVTEQNAIDNANREGIDLGSITLLISSHHGADTGHSNSVPWLSKLRPRAGIFSANLSYATYTHPRCNTVRGFYDHAASTTEVFDISCGDDRTPAALTLAGRLFVVV